MRGAGERLAPHLALGIASASLVGCADALYALLATGAWASLSSLLLGAALLLPAGALLGAAAFVVDELLVRRGALPFLRARLAGGTDSALWSLALLTALSCMLALFAPLHALYVRVAAGLQDEDFAVRLSELAFGLELLALVLLTLLLAGAVRGVLGFVAGQWPAFSPRRARSIVVCGVMLLCVVALARFMLLDVDLLGAALCLPYAALLGLVMLLLRASPAHGWLLALSRRRAFWPALVLAFVLVAPLSSALRPWNHALAASIGPARVMDLLAGITDVDHDGQSGLFGGSDCAPFDALRGPLAFDVPGNHVDEDCNGRDAQPSRQAAQLGSSRRPASLLPPELVKRYNVVLIVVDAFRADHMARPGARSLTPQLDRLAKESVRFTHAFAQAPSTRISFPSFMSGRWPHQLGFTRQRGFLQLAAEHDTLAVWFRRAGYSTAFVSARWMVTHLFGVFRGYDQVIDIRGKAETAITPRLSGYSSTARGIEQVERATLNDRPRNELGAGRSSAALPANLEDKPFFLTLYYEGPHSPYDDQSDLGVPARSRKPADRYAAEIRLVDQQVGSFIDHLRMKPKLWASTVVVVMSDHGEELGEHGGSYHDRTCYVESTHVPLIVRVPGLPPAVAHARVALVDVAPTLVALTGIKAKGKLDGRNLLHADPARYAHEPDGRTFCTFFLDPDPKGTLIQSVRDARWSYMHNFRRGSGELYDTQLDPTESRNLFKTQPRIAQPLRELLSSSPFMDRGKGAAPARRK